MRIRRSLAVGVGLALFAPLASTGAAAAPSATVTEAKAWMLTQQQADGGFEVSGFPGFETPDAALALAAIANEGPTWDTGAALAAVEAEDTAGGKTALDALDDQVDGESDPTSDAAATRATKAVALVAVPLGLDPTDFDPSGDSANPVDLIDRFNDHRNPDGSYDLGSYFNGVLFAAIALDATGTAPTAAHIAQITGGQRPDGSWDYTGTPDAGPGTDIDTTAAALLALKAAGLDRTDPDVAAGVAYLRTAQQSNGAWQAFGADDPNATAMAAIALSALHVDVTAAPYVSPYAWLASQQDADGHIESPNDSFGVNTFATSQAIEALSRQVFLNGERADLLVTWADTLASSAAIGDASDALGPNSSTKAARAAAAGTIVNGQQGREAAAEALFQAAFGRSLDPSGRAYWSNKLKSISRPEMLSRLTGSSEYYRTAGSTIPGFVDAVYQSVLGRAGDPSGRAYWIGRLQKGASVQVVARSLVASNEYRRLQVNLAFDRLLNRPPTTGELDYWMTKIKTTRVEVLLQTLAASQEYYDARSTEGGIG